MNKMPDFSSVDAGMSWYDDEEYGFLVCTLDPLNSADIGDMKQITFFEAVKRIYEQEYIPKAYDGLDVYGFKCGVMDYSHPDKSVYDDDEGRPLRMEHVMSALTNAYVCAGGSLNY